MAKKMVRSRSKSTERIRSNSRKSEDDSGSDTEIKISEVVYN